MEAVTWVTLADGRRATLLPRDETPWDEERVWLHRESRELNVKRADIIGRDTFHQNGSGI